MDTSAPVGLLLVALCLVRCQAVINVADYVFWTKDSINKWHQFLPTRILNEESLMIEMAEKSLLSNISSDLKKILTYQYKELETVKQVIEGTDAEGCISGISMFLDKAVNEEQEGYEGCTAEVPTKLTRFATNLNRMNISYQLSYKRALAGIDKCASTYPNKDSIDRLRSCVDSMDISYFTAANKTQKSLSPSPAMSYFQENVVKCARTAAENIATKGSQFLMKLDNCASLSGTLSAHLYKDKLSQWKGYKDTLARQFSESQSIIYNQVMQVEYELFHYYNLKKEALHAYILESLGSDFYYDKINKYYLHDYYNTVTATSVDNPGDTDCTDSAKSELDNIVASAANLAESHDKEIVKDTKNLIANIYENFEYINNLLPTVGNAALLNCYSQGYIFAPNTILDCFKLKASGFKVEYIGHDEKINEHMNKLNKYVDTFYSSTELPSGKAEVNRMFLDADTTLYTLQRCLYTSSGTAYEVTTPPTVLASTTEIYTFLTPTTETGYESEVNVPSDWSIPSYDYYPEPDYVYYYF